MGQIGATTNRRSWRRNTYIWVLSALTAAFALIYWEQTALLFVLSTLAMCGLLLGVAFADLEGRDKEFNKQIERDPTHMTESVVTTDSSSSNLADSKNDKKAVRRGLKENS